MKRFIFFVAAILFLGGVSGQTFPKVPPQIMPYSYYKFPGYLASDSGIMQAVRVPNFKPVRAGMSVYNPADSSFYIYSGFLWHKMGGGGGVADSNVVHRNGTDTITGNKFFNGTDSVTSVNLLNTTLVLNASDILMQTGSSAHFYAGSVINMNQNSGGINWRDPITSAVSNIHNLSGEWDFIAGTGIHTNYLSLSHNFLGGPVIIGNQSDSANLILNAGSGTTKQSFITFNKNGTTRWKVGTIDPNGQNFRIQHITSGVPDVFPLTLNASSSNFGDPSIPSVFNGSLNNIYGLTNFFNQVTLLDSLIVQGKATVYGVVNGLNYISARATSIGDSYHFTGYKPDGTSLITYAGQSGTNDGYYALNNAAGVKTVFLNGGGVNYDSTAFPFLFNKTKDDSLHHWVQVRGTAYADTLASGVAVSSMLKADAGGHILPAIAGTDYALPGSGGITPSDTAAMLSGYVSKSRTDTIFGSKIFTSRGIEFRNNDSVNLVNGDLTLHQSQIDIYDGMPINWHKPGGGFMGFIQDNGVNEWQLETDNGIHTTFFTTDVRIPSKLKIGNNNAPAQALDVAGVIRQSSVGNAIVKANAAGDLVPAVAGVDFAAASGSGSYIQNQIGSNLSAQSGKMYITDTIRTNGSIISGHLVSAKASAPGDSYHFTGYKADGTSLITYAGQSGTNDGYYALNNSAGVKTLHLNGGGLSYDSTAFPFLFNKTKDDSLHHWVQVRGTAYADTLASGVAVSSMLKADAGGHILPAVAGTDYATPASVALKLNISDTSSMLSGYARTGNLPSSLLLTDSVQSGNYTPTLTGVANVTASTVRQCQFGRSGKFVTVSGLVQVQPTADPVLTTFTLTLPIATTFTTSYQASGTGGGITGSNFNNFVISSTSGSNTVSVSFLSQQHVFQDDCQFTFSYKIQ